MIMRTPRVPQHECDQLSNVVNFRLRLSQDYFGLCALPSSHFFATWMCFFFKPGRDLETAFRLYILYRSCSLYGTYHTCMDGLLDVSRFDETQGTATQP